MFIEHELFLAPCYPCYLYVVKPCIMHFACKVTITIKLYNAHIWCLINSSECHYITYLGLLNPNEIIIIISNTLALLQMGLLNHERCGTHGVGIV